MTDPRGHAFAGAVPGHGCGPLPLAHARLLPGGWRQCPPYLLGCDLYNHQYWWEAHEAWEGLWRSRLIGLSPAEALFEPVAAMLQGLIQVAAAALKAESGEGPGVARLLARAEANLRRGSALAAPPRAGAPGESAAPMAERLLGLPLASWWAQVQAWGEPALGPDRLAGLPPPLIVLE